MLFSLYIDLFNENVGFNSVVETCCNGFQKIRSLNSCDCTTAYLNGNYLPDIISFAGELQYWVKWIVNSRD